MAALQPLQKVYVQYSGDDLWHGRGVLSHAVANDHVVVTFDYDVFAEDLRRGNPDIAGVGIQAQAGVLPAGLAGDAVYAPAPLLGEDLTNLRVEGMHLAVSERVMRGLPADFDRGALPRAIAEAPLGTVAGSSDDVRVPGLGGEPALALGLPRGTGLDPAGLVPTVSPPGLWVVDEPSGVHFIGEPLSLEQVRNVYMVGLIRLDMGVVKVLPLMPGAMVKEYMQRHRHQL